MNKLITGITLVSLLVFGNAGFCKEAEKIHLGTMPTYSAAIYAVGIEKAFFRKAGVDVDLKVFRSARDRDSAATAGQLDGFMTDIMGAINLNVKGFPFIITSREYDDFGVMAGPHFDTSSNKTHTIGISQNTVIEYIVDTFMDQKLKKVNILAVPDRMGALLGGKLDYGVFPQPFMNIIMGNGGKPMMKTAEKGFHPVVLVFNKQFIKKHKTAVNAFYAGYQNAVSYMQSTDFSAYKSVLVTHGLATEKTVSRYRIPVHQYGLNPLSEENFNNVSRWMLRKKLLKQNVDINRVSSSEFMK